MTSKIGITGHTRGIGKALHDVFAKQNYLVKGFSTSNGFDISDDESRIQIIDEIEDFDIFINNAYHKTGQTLLLEKAIDSWKDKNKLIINISSKMIYYTREGFEDYISAKIDQNKIVRDRMFTNTPKILNIIVGAVDTDMAKIWQSDKINPTDLAKFIYDMVQYQNLLAIQEVVIDVPGIHWGKIKLCQTP